MRFFLWPYYANGISKILIRAGMFKNAHGLFGLPVNPHPHPYTARHRCYIQMIKEIYAEIATFVCSTKIQVHIGNRYRRALVRKIFIWPTAANVSGKGEEHNPHRVRLCEVCTFAMVWVAYFISGMLDTVSYIQK